MADGRQVVGKKLEFKGELWQTLWRLWLILFLCGVLACDLTNKHSCAVMYGHTCLVQFLKAEWIQLHRSQPNLNTGTMVFSDSFWGFRSSLSCTSRKWITRITRDLSSWTRCTRPSEPFKILDDKPTLAQILVCTGQPQNIHIYIYIIKLQITNKRKAILPWGTPLHYTGSSSGLEKNKSYIQKVNLVAVGRCPVVWAMSKGRSIWSLFW